MEGGFTENIEKFDEEVLNTFEKEQLVKLVMELQREKKELEGFKDQRMIDLERSHFLYLQYGRRESIEISGIPKNIEEKKLQKEVIKIYKEAEVTVEGRELTAFDIASCHRIGKKGVTVCRFVNRKFAWQGMANGKKLKDKRIYDGDVYINNSFCDEFQKYGYYIRRLKKAGAIYGYKLKSGVYYIKKGIADDFRIVSHISDFDNYDLDISHLIKEKDDAPRV